MVQPQRQHENNHSSLFTKLSPDLRRAIDIAIIERVPPTFHAAWMQFELAKHGVSYTAFYRYARRLRDRANLAEITALATDDDGDLETPIRKLVSRRLVELLLNTDEEVSVKEIAVLMSAQRHAARAALSDRRLNEQARLAEKRLNYDRKRLRLMAQSLRSNRRRPANPSDDLRTLRLPHLDEAKSSPNDVQTPTDSEQCRRSETRPNGR